MHPVLESRWRLLAYLLAWAPLYALLQVVNRAASGMSWRESVGALAPACLIYAFACLSPWYICRALPLRFEHAVNVAGTWAAAAIGGSLVLVGSAQLLAMAIGVDAKLSAALPLMFGLGILVYLLSAGLHYAAIAAAQSHEAERRIAEARALAREAQLHALKMQVNPHFLFNSLNSIAALAPEDGMRAREMCVRLAEFFRSSLGLGHRETVPLREELALARSYLEVEQLRFGDRLSIEEKIAAECQECAVPALLLQPLVENAVKHGVSALPGGGAIRLLAARFGQAVSITVENGFDPEMGARRSNGIGLENVRRRLQVRYGEQASCEAGAAGDVYRVVLRFPCESPIASSKRA